MKALILACAILAAAADPAGLAGDYGNVTSSPFTGDIWGNELTIKSEEGVWSGTWMQAERFEDPRAVTGISYDKQTTLLRFHVTDADGTDHACAVRKTIDGVLFKLDEKKDERWQYLRSGNKSSRDYASAFITKSGVHLTKKPAEDNNPAERILEIPAEEKVNLNLYEENSIQDGYVICSYKGKKGFIDEQFLWPPENQIVTGSNVRLREKPDAGSAVITTLPEGTAVQVIMPEDGEWIRVMVDGRKGYINYKYVSE